MTTLQAAQFAAILGVGMPEPHIQQCVELAEQLHQSDLRIMRLIREEEVSGIDHGDQIEQVLDDAGELLSQFPKANLQLYFNDELPRDSYKNPIGGRLRVEWEGSKWDGDNPSYLAMPDEIYVQANALKHGLLESNREEVKYHRGAYVGPVVEINEATGIVVQAIGRGKWVQHSLEFLKDRPEEGKGAQINYRDGQAKVEVLDGVGQQRLGR